MSKKRIVIIGAGPGGLAAGMILANRGFDVTIVEKGSKVGGRTSEIKLGEYSFDTGPTFLHQKFTLDETFAEVGREASDYLDLIKLDPMTKLTWGDKTLETTYDQDVMAENIEEAFPGHSEGYRRFMEDHADKLQKIYPVLQKPYHKLTAFCRKELLKVFPYIATSDTVVDVLDRYFPDDNLKLAFTFQSKYLGMSPWKCPALFTILSYTEYKYGIYHTTGGLCKIPEAMAKVFAEEGGELRLNTPVQEVLFKGTQAIGVKLESGEELKADHVVMNADYANAMNSIMNGFGKTKKQLEGKKYSCSTFMLYLGLDTIYEDEPHHHIMFADDYQKNIDEISGEKVVSDDMSIYIRNSSVTDKTVAPEGHSQLYILVPTINCRHGMNWEETKIEYRNKVLDRLEQRTSMKDLRSHIVEEAIYTPDTWRDSGIFMGATFNLAHTIDQMLYFRPHNKLSGYKNLFLVGGGTHPGSGLPTILESARISSKLICEEEGVETPDVDLATAVLAS